MKRLSRGSAGSGHSLAVALDAGILAQPPSGVSAYVANLQDALNRCPDISLTTLAMPPVLRRLGNRAGRLAWDALLVEVWCTMRAPDVHLLHVPAFSAPLHTRVPLVVTIHDIIPMVLPEYRATTAMRAYLALVRRTVRRASIVLTPSHAAASDVARVLAVPEARIRVTPLAPDPSFTPADDARAVADAVRDRFGIEGRYILSMAGLDRRKNVSMLIEAFSRALPMLPDDATLVLAGAPHTSNPAVFPPVEPVIERLGVGSRVVLAGRVSGDERLLLYQGARAYATPSVYEGFGLTPLEAMASGVPVIAANRTSLPEVVGDAGMLVEPEVDALAEAIVAVVTDEVAHADLRARGLIRASRFSWERTAELTVAAYREAVS